MRKTARIALMVAIAAAPAMVAAEVEDSTKWVPFVAAKLGLHVKHPKSAKVALHGATIEITGPELPKITIAVAPSDDLTTDKHGGISELHVEYRYAAPRRSATCIADAADADQADAASYVCESVVLDAAPKKPHIELHVTSSGLADAAAFERAVAAKQHALDACWKQALAREADLPGGSITFTRTYDHGHAAQSSQSLENFFDHDAKPLGACVFAILKAVPAKTVADAADTKVEAICQLY